MSEWQPIETALLDGTEVILRFVVRDGTARPVEVLSGWYDGSWRRICYNKNRYQYFSLGDVTHWMPLPKPPSSTGADFKEIIYRENTAMINENVVYCPAPEVAKLVEALEEMIDVAERVDSWESFPSAPLERAEDALHAYRALESANKNQAK